MKQRAVVLPGLTVIALAFLHRYARHWGATAAEFRAALPADDLIPRPQITTTHAVTIHTPPAEVWPWVVQMGYYRGGWFTDTDWWDFLPDRYLRALVRQDVARTGQGHREEPSADRILPEFQDLKVGDTILDGPPGTTFFTVAALEPQRLLALYSDSHARYLFPRRVRDNPRWGIGGEFTWVFVLQPADEGDTRLLLRTRAVARPRLYRLFLSAFLPLVDWPLTRKMLTGIKHRAEP